MSLTFPGRSKSLVELVQAQRELAHEQQLAAIHAKELPVSNGTTPGKQPPRMATFTCRQCGVEQPQCRTGHPRRYCDDTCRKAFELSERRRIHEEQNADRLESILRLHRLGQNAVQIAEALGLHRSAVREKLKALGLILNGSRP